MAAPTPYASPSLYVGDLVHDVTEALLFEIFNAVGPVASVRVCRDAATRKSLGYAYVNFHRVEDAERALDTMNFKPIRNRQCRIMWSHRDPSLRKSGLGNIFIKNLAQSIDNKALYDTFSMFGNILSCKVAMNSKHESLGYGFVHYEGEEAAATAIAKVNNKVISGQKVTVSAFKSRKERGAGKFKFTNVYVKNIPVTTTKDELINMFSRCGEITSAMIAEENDGNSRGFGFVNFKSPEEAQQACESLNGFEVADKKLTVVRAQPKEEREKELRDRFEQLKIENLKKYAGVNLYVKNLSDQIDDAKLRQEFEKFGTITSARVMMEGPRSRGFGFVCFSVPEEANKAVQEMNGRTIDSKPLYVALAQRKEVRRQQLEAQYNSRMKGPMMPPQMYADMGGPPQNLGYYSTVPRPYYQQHPMMRQWPGQGGGMPMAHPNYQLIPMAHQPRGGGGSRGGGTRGRGGSQGPRGGKGAAQGAVKYGETVRNREQQPQRQPQALPGNVEPLTIKALAVAPEEQRKQMIGERLFPLIRHQQPDSAGKITGMLLEMDNGELLHLLENPVALKEKVDEALAVLRDYNDAE